VVGNVGRYAGLLAEEPASPAHNTHAFISTLDESSHEIALSGPAHPATRIGSV
jgi:hypothetical protein